MLLIGLKNVGEQTVLASGLVNVGNVYRKFCKILTKKVIVV